MLARPQATFVFVYIVLLALLAATVGIAHLELGAWNPVFNIAIAASKAFLIIWFFMHVREETGLVRVFAFAALFWLGILFALSLTDYLTRGPS